MKMIMKEQTNKANNLRLGAIYINANTGTPCRLVHIVPCEGVWLETFDGQGYGDLVKFEDVAYADADEVQDFLDDHAVWSSHTDAPSFKDDSPAIYPSDKGYKPEREFAYGKEIVRDEDGNAVIGWYDDNDGNDYRCRD
jgi:hypothetical protein